MFRLILQHKQQEQLKEMIQQDQLQMSNKWNISNNRHKIVRPVITLSTENDKRLLQQLRTGFKRTIKWNKQNSERTNQTKNNNLNYLIDPTLIKINKLFVLSFQNENDRTSFLRYYVPNVQIKDFNVLIDRKSFFHMPIKKWQRNIRTNYRNGKKQ